MCYTDKTLPCSCGSRSQDQQIIQPRRHIKEEAASLISFLAGKSYVEWEIRPEASGRHHLWLLLVEGLKSTLPQFGVAQAFLLEGVGQNMYAVAAYICMKISVNIFMSINLQNLCATCIEGRINRWYEYEGFHGLTGMFEFSS